ncbi:hypothetical protein L911_2722 [Vibrio fluvialis I21563]|nr:hypothetical protein L911_2722 [Vibrio fluvialis I21563]
MIVVDLEGDRFSEKIGPTSSVNMGSSLNNVSAQYSQIESS